MQSLGSIATDSVLCAPSLHHYGIDLKMSTGDKSIQDPQYKKRTSSYLKSVLVPLLIVGIPEVQFMKITRLICVVTADNTSEVLLFLVYHVTS